MIEQQEQTVRHYTVTLGALARDGDALAEVVVQNEEGEQAMLTLHVPAGLPGEQVTIAVEEPRQPKPGKKHRRRWKARPPRVWITEVHEPSPLRVAALCPVFGVCGGCQLQHMHYEAQLTWKRDVVSALLQQHGISALPLLDTVPCAIPWHYRNHMRFSVNRDGQPGLTARGTHRVLPLRACPIAHEYINLALPILAQQNNPRPQVLMRCGTQSQQMLIQPVQPEAVAEQLRAHGLDPRSETMEEQLAGETFRIRPSSFFQTNTAQAEKMAQMVLNGLLTTATGQRITDATALTVVDAYCGVGTFALLLARHFGKVIAIEESASAIKDAQWNLRGVGNVEILKGKVEDVLPGISTRLDGFVIDPPRAGCQQIVLDTLIHHPVAKIVYVSCEPATLARDLNILCNLHSTYRLRSVQPLDMFPQTAHIECVAVLEHNA